MPRPIITASVSSLHQTLCFKRIGYSGRTRVGLHSQQFPIASHPSLKHLHIQHLGDRSALENNQLFHGTTDSVKQGLG